MHLLVKLKNPWLRVPLFTLYFWVKFPLLCLRMVLNGYGHQLLMFEFWNANYYIYWAVVEGEFVCRT